MKRYCSNCEIEFDFNVKSKEDLENLYCPECGKKIDANSRKPIDPKIEENEETIGNVMFGIFKFMYIFYLLMSLLGIIGYIFKIDILLYETTIICLVAFFAQILTKHETFKTGRIIIPIAVVLGYFINRDIRDVCLAILLVFLIRHILRDILFGTIWKIIRSSKE